MAMEDFMAFLAEVRKTTGIDALAADEDEFTATLEKILQLCDIWAERIKGLLAGEHEGADGRAGRRAAAEVPAQHMIRA